MIYHISGKLVKKTPVTAVIESFGIAWEMGIALSTYEKLPLLGENCLLYAYLNIAQDAIKLYGFATEGEKAMFELLLSVSGVGPKIAISVISSITLPAFIRSVQHNDEHILVKVPGLGKKSVQRLILELKDKAEHLSTYLEKSELLVMDKDSLELENALIALGFNVRDIRRELADMRAQGLDLSLEQMIKETIKRLYQRSK